MGRLRGKIALTARATEDSLPLERAQTELRARGISVVAVTLAERSVSECIDAISWAHNRRPLSARPAWIGELIDQGKADLIAGICLACGCDDERDCSPYGCDWWNDAHTICSNCCAAPPAFVQRVIARLHAKGLGARAEIVGDRSYVFASHPYGPERSITITNAAVDHAVSETGAVVTVWDVVDRLLARLRQRSAHE